VPLILEGLVTTLDAAGAVNLAPMGPIVDRDITRLLLRPYQSSTTYQNLKRSPQGVLHVIDNVELIAAAAVNRLSEAPPTRPAVSVEGQVLADACRWFEFRVDSLDDSRDRTEIECRVVHRGQGRPFFGFNRAKHAVLEAAILATRIEFLPPQEIARQLTDLAIIVEKTAGDQEQRAWRLLLDYARAESPEIRSLLR